MAKVRITSQLLEKLKTTKLTPALLFKHFSAWKDGDAYSSYWFSQDKVDHKTGLAHAHLVPHNSPAQLERWDSDWESKHPWTRRSDCYVLYAHDKMHGYLLIDVLWDPGAHDLWSPGYRKILKDYETVADNFIFCGHVP